MICTKCGQSKNETEFYWIKQRQKRDTQCKTCKRVAKREYYHKNKEEYKRRNREWRRKNPDAASRNQKRTAERNRTLFFKWLADKSCIVCGESDPVVLDLHHRNPTNKLGSIGSLIGGSSANKLFAEIAKCDVLCANCHRRVHFEIDGDGIRRMNMK